MRGLFKLKRAVPRGKIFIVRGGIVVSSLLHTPTWREERYRRKKMWERRGPVENWKTIYRHSKHVRQSFPGGFLVITESVNGFGEYKRARWDAHQKD